MLNHLPTILTAATPAAALPAAASARPGNGGSGFASLMQQQTNLRLAQQRLADGRQAEQRLLEQRPAAMRRAESPPASPSAPEAADAGPPVDTATARPGSDTQSTGAGEPAGPAAARRLAGRQPAAAPPMVEADPQLPAPAGRHAHATTGLRPTLRSAAAGDGAPISLTPGLTPGGARRPGDGDEAAVAGEPASQDGPTLPTPLPAHDLAQDIAQLLAAARPAAPSARAGETVPADAADQAATAASRAPAAERQASTAADPAAATHTSAAAHAGLTAPQRPAAESVAGRPAAHAAGQPTRPGAMPEDTALAATQGAGPAATADAAAASAAAAAAASASAAAPLPDGLPTTPQAVPATPSATGFAPGGAAGPSSPGIAAARAATASTAAPGSTSREGRLRATPDARGETPAVDAAGRQAGPPGDLHPANAERRLASPADTLGMAPPPSPVTGTGALARAIADTTSAANAANAANAAPAAEAASLAEATPAGVLPGSLPALQALAGTAAATATGTGAGAEAHIRAPVDSPAFAPALGAQLSLFARDGVQMAQLQLNPAEMGPIRVQIALDGLATRIDFQADLAATRELIEASLPALAGALQDAGLTLSGGGVFQHTPGRQDAGDGQAAGRGAAASDRRDGQGAADLPAPETRQRERRGLVDLVA